MKKHAVLRSIALVLLVLMLSCAPDPGPGANLSGKDLSSRDFRGIDLTGANLSGADLRHATMGFGTSFVPKPEQVFEGVTCAQWLSDGTLVDLCNTESVQVWNADKAAFAQTVELPKDSDIDISGISPDGTMLIFSTRDSGRSWRRSLWNTKTDTSYPLALDGDVTTFEWSPDGSHLLMDGPERAWMWDIVNNTLMDSVDYNLSSPSWSNDGRTVAYASYHESLGAFKLEFWDIATNNRDRTFPIPSETIAEIDWSPDDKMILVARSDVTKDVPQGEILEAESGAHIRYLENLACRECDLDSLAWSPDGRKIAGGTSYGALVIWDAETGGIIREFVAHDGESRSLGGNVDLRWSGDGALLISNHRHDRVVKQWDVSKIFRTATLTGSNLTNANLSFADMAGLDLSGVTLTGANLNGANLRGANLSGLDLRTVILAQSNLSGANLANSDLSGADLSGAIIAQANLENTNLNGANLRGIAPLEYLLKPVCKGTGIAVMPPYSNQPGIHPLVMLNHNGGIHEWNKAVSDEWRPAGDRLPQVVACVGEYTEIEIDTCSYGFGSLHVTSFRLMQSRVEMTVRHAHSAAIIATTTIDGPLSTCPESVEVGTKRLPARLPQFGDASAWLSQFVAQ